MSIADPSLLRLAAEHAIAHLEAVAARPAGARASVTELRAALSGPLPARGVPGPQVIDELVRDADPGLVASPGPRYFGFVTGGALPAALAADWLAAAWDQNAFSAVSSPAAAAVEEVAAEWLKELLGLPGGASVGLVTGAQMANVTALAAARHRVLEAVGWDVADRGLVGAPPVSVIVGAEAHVTVLRALRLLGFGTGTVTEVPVDGQGRMRADALARALAGEGPAIVCAQAGNVNTGACDPLDDIVTAARARGAWVHVDGAFGLWAAASPPLAPLVAGADAAHSWATDAHKWLNVPYDCGVVAVADPAAHHAAMALTAAYLTRAGEGERSNSDWAPEASRRARGFAVYAALRALGRDGVADLVDRCCALARRMAAALGADPALTVLNDVVLNQVLVQVGDAAVTDAAVAAVQRDGTCWLAGTHWQGRPAIRISISNWATTEADVERAAAAIGAAVRSAFAQ
ncbi:MAG TPA: aminotransferase class V-fold PLP-dependent enzyme [Solirubrobacteraceae bacterium]|nr:aminotransferase class V-fold PLP-dependent enzyme [Solirubrobacteraceae bacterium]